MKLGPPDLTKSPPDDLRDPIKWFSQGDVGKSGWDDRPTYKGL